MPANRQIKHPTGAQTAGIVISVMMVVLLLAVNAAVQMIYGGPRGNELSVATVFSSPQDVSVDEMIKKGSLKLRIMASLTQATDSKSASYNWRDNVYLQHEQEMISKLMKACY